MTGSGPDPSARATLDAPPRVPLELCGLWRRVSYERPDAPPDTTTRVYWLQTPTLYVDLRVPAARDVGACGAGARLEELSDALLATLATQEGFAGWTSLEGNLCRWHRDIDFQPPSGVPDEGRLEIDGDCIVEHGVHVPYREVWRRVPGSTGDWLAGRAVGDAASGGRTTYLVAGGDWFLYARSRRSRELPRTDSLADLIAARTLERAELVELLDFEISLGRRDGGAQPWQIVLSTLPFREGATLAPVVRRSVARDAREPCEARDAEGPCDARGARTRRTREATDG
ncbi:MAG TPA: hypothetical protein VIS07_17605 [Candidatus Binatia bacterium]